MCPFRRTLNGLKSRHEGTPFAECAGSERLRPEGHVGLSSGFGGLRFATPLFAGVAVI
jgi:hypothetical protein